MEMDVGLLADLRLLLLIPTPAFLSGFMYLQ